MAKGLEVVTAIHKGCSVHLNGYFIKVFCQEEECQWKIVGAIGTDKGDRQIDPTEGIKEFIECGYKAYGREGKQDNNYE